MNRTHFWSRNAPTRILFLNSNSGWMVTLTPVSSFAAKVGHRTAKGVFMDIKWRSTRRHVPGQEASMTKPAETGFIRLNTILPLSQHIDVTPGIVLELNVLEM